MTDRGSLEITCRELAAKVGAELRQLRAAGLGYCLLVFDHEVPGNVAFVSGSRRTDLVRTMGSFVLEAAASGVRSVFEREQPT